MTNANVINHNNVMNPNNLRNVANVHVYSESDTPILKAWLT
jgi:hypothetical protein